MVARIGKAADGVGPRLWRYSNEADQDAAQSTVADAQILLVGADVDNPVKIAEAMTFLLQEQLDVRYRRNTLHSQDPVRRNDPATERVFWDGIEVVERATIVEVMWDGIEYITKLRGARG